MNGTPVLELRGAGLVHRSGRLRTVALHPTDLTLGRGESVAVVGRSGAGKTTLADLALGLRRPSHGQVLIDGARWTPGRIRRARRRLVQGVPQDPAVTLPPGWTVGATLRTAARRLLPGVDVEHRVAEAVSHAQLDPALLTRRPHELSGGQAQRVALARALVARPALVVADEPTSALDRATADAVVRTLLDLPRAGVGVLVVTHDPGLAERCDRLLRVERGRATEHRR